MHGRQLRDVPEHHSFRLGNGVQIRNLYELCLHLAAMDDSTFRHHVNDSKNDFMNWVLDIVKDENLAKKLSSKKTRHSMASAVEKRITELEQEKRHHEKVVEQGIKWGVREFSIGLATGIFIALIFFRASGIL